MPFETLSFEERKGWFNTTLFWKNAARFWPLWLLYAAVQFFVLPMGIIMDVRWEGQAEAILTLRQDVCAAIEGTAVVGLIFGLLYAMALFSYLMNSRSVGMIHTLPIRREGLFLTNYATAFCFLLIPDAAMALLTVVAAGAQGAELWREVLLWLVMQIVVGMFFFSFAVCCAMFTGHILALPVFYGILNGLVAGMAMLLDEALGVLLVGYSGNLLNQAAFTRWCTPVWHITGLLEWWKVYDDEGLACSLAIESPAAAVGYALVLFVLFTFIALWVYRLRELERAGDVVTVGWVRPVFQYGLGVCFGLMAGVAIYLRFFYRSSPWIFILLTAAGAVVGAFVGRMLLKKTLRVFADGWRGPVVLGACMILLLEGARADLFGYQRRVPDPERVVNVTVDSLSTAPYDSGAFSSLLLTDPEDIRAVTRIHAALVSDVRRLSRAQREEYYTEKTSSSPEEETQGWKRLRLYYNMEDGTVLQREYDRVPITAEELATQGTYACELQELLSRPTAIRQAYLCFMDVDMDFEAVGGWLENVKLPEGEEAAPDADPESRNKGRVILTGEEARALWQAVETDLARGDLGRRYLLDDRRRYENCLQTDLWLNLMGTWTDQYGKRQTHQWAVDFTIQNSAGETLKALEKLGYTDYLASWVD